jgi:hypothetical protein
LRAPLGKYEAIGDVKSASGPATNREIVFEIEINRTCVDVVASTLLSRIDMLLVVLALGRESTMDPILAITISHCSACQLLSYGKQ